MSGAEGEGGRAGDGVTLEARPRSAATPPGGTCGRPRGRRWVCRGAGLNEGGERGGIGYGTPRSTRPPQAPAPPPAPPHTSSPPTHNPPLRPLYRVRFSNGPLATAPDGHPAEAEARPAGADRVRRTAAAVERPWHTRGGHQPQVGVRRGCGEGPGRAWGAGGEGEGAGCKKGDTHPPTTPTTPTHHAHPAGTADAPQPAPAGRRAGAGVWPQRGAPQAACGRAAARAACPAPRGAGRGVTGAGGDWGAGRRGRGGGCPVKKGARVAARLACRTHSAA